MTCSSAYERLSFYVLNGCIVRSSGVIERHLVDSPLNTCEIKQHHALNNSITMIMVVDGLDGVTM